MFICAITEYFQGELVGDGSFRALAWCSHSCCHSALIWTKQRKTKWKESKKAEPHQPNPKKPNQGRIAQFLGMTLSETGPSSWFWKHQLQFLNSCIILSLVSPLFNKNQGQSESLWAHSAEGSGTPWLTFPIAQWLTGRTGRDLGKPSPCPSSLCRWMMLWSGSEPSSAQTQTMSCYQDNSFCLHAAIISQPYLQWRMFYSVFMPWFCCVHWKCEQALEWEELGVMQVWI